MKNSKADNVSITENLIRIEYFEKSQSIPYADDSINIVIMKQVGNDLHYYKTLKTTADRLSVSESLEGPYVFFSVDMRPRHLHIDQKYRFINISQGIRVVAEITYQAKDAKKVVLATEDALLAFQTELKDLFRRETNILTLQDAKHIEATRKLIHDKISLELDRVLEQTGLYITHIYFNLYLQENELVFKNLVEGQTVKFSEDGNSSAAGVVQRLEGNPTTDAPPPKKKRKHKGK